MRTETDEIRDNLKYLTLLARDYPSQAAAASEIISNQAPAGPLGLEVASKPTKKAQRRMSGQIKR